MVDNIGVDTLKANLTNPARQYMWDVIIPSPIGGGDSKALQFRARATQIPVRENTAINIPYKQTAGFQVAGKLKYDHTWQCEFVEGEDGKVYEALYKWQQAIVNDSFGVGVGDPLYKTDGFLVMLKTSGEAWKKFRLFGLWVQTVQQLALAYDTDDYLKIVVVFAFDRFEIET